MTERDDDNELQPPAETSNVEQRALSDAIRDALLAGSEAPERTTSLRAPTANTPEMPDAPPQAPTSPPVAPPDAPQPAPPVAEPVAPARAEFAESAAEPVPVTPEREPPAAAPDARAAPDAPADADAAVDAPIEEGFQPDHVLPAEMTSDLDEDSTSRSAASASIDPAARQDIPEHGEVSAPMMGARAASGDPSVPSAGEVPLSPEEAAADAAGGPIVARRITRRGVIAVGARAVTGAVGVVIAVAAIVGATVLPEPRYSLEPPALTVEPIPAAQQRVCPGPLLRLGDDEGQEATTATSVGRAAGVFQASPREADSAPLGETENTAGVAPLLLTLPPESAPAGAGVGGNEAAVAGSQSQTVAAGDLVGFAAAECSEPSGDSWLVGGSTDVGRTTLVTLSNPSTVAATVDLEIFGPTGILSAPGSQGIVVQPGVQRIFSLAGFAPQIVSPVVHVTSRGGLVVANLQQTTVRTLDPGGVDIVGATRGPSRSAVIPGVQISTASAITEAQGAPGFEDLQTTLRMLAGTTTTATVTITPEEGTVVPGRADSVAAEGAPAGDDRDSTGFEVTLTAGQVTDLPVPGLADGVYTMTIESDDPIVAGARTSTIGPRGATDFAWIPAGQTLRDSTLVSAASGPSPVLHVANPTDEDRTVTVTVDDTGDRTDEGPNIEDAVLEVGAGETVDTPLRGGLNVALTGAAGLVATVTYSGPGVVGAFGVTAPGPASTPLVVYR